MSELAGVETAEPDPITRAVSAKTSVQPGHEKMSPSPIRTSAVWLIRIAPYRRMKAPEAPAEKVDATYMMAVYTPTSEMLSPVALGDGGCRDGQHQGRHVGECLLDEHRDDRDPQPLRLAGGRWGGVGRGSLGRRPGGRRPVRSVGLHDERGSVRRRLAGADRAPHVRTAPLAIMMEPASIAPLRTPRVGAAESRFEAGSPFGGARPRQVEFAGRFGGA